MELELSVRDSHGIKNGLHICCGPGGSERVTQVGFTVFDERFVGAKMAAQTVLGASYYSQG
jgi:hypothetical protein